VKQIVSPIEKNKMNPILTTVDSEKVEQNITLQNSAQPWVVCFTAALFFFYEFIQMNMFNAISSDLMRDFSITATQLSRLSSIYFYANLLFFPVAGTLLDRFSTRKIILVTLSLCVIGIGIFSQSHTLFVSGIARFISGVGSAFCFLSSIRLASRWFPANRMALISGLIVAMAMTGGMMAQTPLTFLTELVGWRYALLMDSFLGVIIAVIIWKFVQDYPPHFHAQKENKERLKAMGLLNTWRISYLNIHNWMAGLYTCFMNLPVAVLGAIWGNLYLTQVHHLTTIQASYAATFLFMGNIIGCPALGWISDRLRRRRLPMTISVLISLILILIVMYSPHLNLAQYLILFFLLGFMTSAQIISYPLVAESNPKQLTATAVSVISFSVISGYPIFQQLFGRLLDLNWQGQMIDNVRVYSASNFHFALMIIPIAFVLAFLISLFVRETHCVRID
jgi:MFS family permease